MFFISSCIPNLLDLTGYCVSTGTSLFSWWVYLLFQYKDIFLLFLSVLLCETFFSIFFTDGTRQVEIASVSVMLS